MRTPLFYLAVSCCLLGLTVAAPDEEENVQVEEEQQNVTEETPHTLDPNCPKFCPHSFRPLCAINSENKHFTFLHKGMCRRHGMTTEFESATSPDP
ncbi:hypothetical protein B566_EDAN013428 [Ephemera danica]|nr:hypothetical protein B566_EDAN013428 [Ephemera danica]